MISKKELMTRICHLELDVEMLFDETDSLKKKLKKLEKEKKDGKKVSK